MGTKLRYSFLTNDKVQKYKIVEVDHFTGEIEVIFERRTNILMTDEEYKKTRRLLCFEE